MNLVTSQANPIWHFRSRTSGPRRIVHVPPRFASSDWSGSESVLLELAKQQLATGMEPIIISSMALCETRHEVIEGIRVHRHPHSYFVMGAGGQGGGEEGGTEDNLLTIPVFQALMQEPEVRLFHTHTLGRLGGEVLHAARMRFRPFVATVHQDPNAGSLIGARKELQDADMVICVDKFEAENAVEALGHDRVSHLPPGVDCARVASGDAAGFRERHGIPATALVLGSLCRSTLQKSLLLLEAFAEASARRHGMHLVLCAPETASQDTVQIKARVHELGLGSHVHLLISCPDEARPDFYAACDVLALLPWHRASAEDVLEIWSAGRPLIGDRFSGIGNLVRDGVTGLLFDPESTTAIEKLTAHIERLATDELLRCKMGEAGRVEAQEYDWSRISAKLEEIYKLAEQNHQIARQQGRMAA